VKKIKVKLGAGRDYNIFIGAEDLFSLKEVKDFFQEYNKIMIVSNDTIYPLYSDKLLAWFQIINKDASACILQDGEEYKTLESVKKIYDACLEEELDRKSLIVAFGGGVVGDIAGFAASTYMRGIDYVQIPTTLLAQVDSSVGGKTGVNHPKCKNMIGAFYQPKMVLANIDTLDTLDDREFKAGLGEIIKYGMILDKGFFKFLDKNMDNILAKDKDLIEEIIYKSCLYKANIVQKDEKEAGIRAILNYGHTIGHAVESVTEYKKYLHGEAIAIGMVYASKLAEQEGLINESVTEAQISLFEKIGLPVSIKDIDVDKIINIIKTDKKFVSGTPCFILPKGIGKVIISKDVSIEDVEEILK
jgi:3-dehydroquinate synthase